MACLLPDGQASWGKRDYDALSDKGFEQGKILGESLKRRGIHPDRIVTGAMTRHKQTAQACLQAMRLPLDWDEDARWNEYDHQELIVRHKPLYRSRMIMMADLARSRQPKKAFQQMFEQALDRWTGGEHHGEYHESWPQFQARTAAALDALTDSNARTILVFTSGGAISSTVARLWHMPTTQWSRLNRVIANATITKVVIGRQGTHLSTFNDHSHFEGEHRNLLTYR